MAETKENTTAALLLIGDELLRGEIADSNGSYFAQKFREIGGQLTEIRVVADEPQLIVEQLRAMAHNRLLLLSGGLGPTSDDLTRDAVAEFCEEALVLDPSSEERLRARYAKRSRVVGENSLRQSMFPASARVIRNPVGTADAFHCVNRKDSSAELNIFCLPGVPVEFRPLVDQEVIPWCVSKYPDLSQLPSRTFRCFGLPESEIGALIDAAGLSSDIRVGYRPHFPFVQVSLFSASRSEELLDCALERAISALGLEFVYAQSTESLPQVVAKLLVQHGRSLALAESCSGGLVAHELVSVAGASEYFLLSAVTYSNLAKQKVLGVTPETLDRYGAVSQQCACEMASGARDKVGSDFGVSITGIAGPDGGSEEKPVGTVWIGISTAEKTQAFRYFLPAERNFFRKYCSAVALDLIRRELLGLRLDALAS